MTRFQTDGFTFDRNQGWESKLLLQAETKELVAFEAGKLAGEIIHDAPRGPHVTTDEYAIRENVHPYVEEVGDEWVGFIVIEENPQARHAMLQEDGWTDRGGRHHQGRHYIRQALARARVE